MLKRVMAFEALIDAHRDSRALLALEIWARAFSVEGARA
jgi:hypothetical protein